MAVAEHRVSIRCVRPHGGLALVESRALADQLGALVALKQRIALQLFLDEGRDFLIGVLEELDGLTQLRRHDQRLGLSELESGTDRHRRLGYNENLSPR